MSCLVAELNGDFVSAIRSLHDTTTHDINDLRFSLRMSQRRLHRCVFSCERDNNT